MDTPVRGLFLSFSGHGQILWLVFFISGFS